MNKDNENIKNKKYLSCTMKLENLVTHGEKKTVESTDVICWNRDSSFFL